MGNRDRGEGAHSLLGLRQAEAVPVGGGPEQSPRE